MKAKLAAALLLFYFGLPAQQPFEGTISYRLHADYPLHSDQKNEDAKLIVSFQNNRVKLEFSEPNKPASDYLLVALDSGLVYTINQENKSFRVRRLISKKVHKTLPPAKTIAGHKTTPAFLNSGDIINILGDPLPNETVLHVADDLYFPVPEQYSQAPELVLVKNGKIILGAEVSISDRDRVAEEYDTVTLNSFQITAEATDVVPKDFAKNELEIPTGFELQTHYGYVTDTTAVADSIDTFTEPSSKTKKESSNNKRKRKTNNSASHKESAVRRKQR